MKIDNKKNGFTLIELMAVIAIIMVLIGLLMPAISGIRKYSKKRQVKAEIIAIQTAITGYHADYNKWPVPESHQTEPDKAYGVGTLGNKEVFDVLTDQLGNLYIQLSDFRANNGNIVDPWGDQYIIKIDTDYDQLWKKNSDSPMVNGFNVSSENN